MSLQITLQANALGQQGNLIVVQLVAGDSTGVVITESDYSQFLVVVTVADGGTYSDIAAALAAAMDCPVTATYAADNPAETGQFLGMVFGEDGQGEGQYYSGVGGRPLFILPQYIKRKSGFFGH